MNIKQDLPRFCVLALLTGLLGCPGTSAVVNPGRNSSLAKGIPGYGATKLDFPDGRNRKFRVKISEPVIVAVASGPQGWGFFQFPSITRWTDRTLSASWSMAADSVVSYSKGGSGNAISKDGGKTWEPLTGPRGIAGLLLPNGDRIAVTTPRPAKVSELRLPRPIGETTDTYSKMKYVLYRLAELPPDQQAVYLRRLPKGESLWVSERARLDDPQALRYSVRGLFPIVWWGDLQLAADGSLVAGIYPGIRMREGGSPDQRWGVFFYRSTDDGHSWQVQGRIPYQPDLRADAKGAARMGFSEPAFQILPDGSFLCVMRTTDGFGNGPMYAARSKDSGRTWSKPARIAPSAAPTEADAAS